MLLKDRVCFFLRSVVHVPASRGRQPPDAASRQAAKSNPEAEDGGCYGLDKAAQKAHTASFRALL